MKFVSIMRQYGVTEKEVICYLLSTEKNWTSREIGELLDVSHATVATWINHVKYMKSKFDTEL